MSLALLKPGSLYIALFIRSHPPERDNFHWALYFHDSLKGGRKYHIKNECGGWIADHKITANVFKSMYLVGLFRISDIASGQRDSIDEAMRKYDGILDRPGMTCKVWVFQVLADLQQKKEGYTALNCTNLISLEKEVRDWGNAEAPVTASDTQPRSLSASQICGLGNF